MSLHRDGKKLCGVQEGGGKMSGIYIPGMEMPTSCFQCEFRTKIDPDNLMCIISQKTFEERFCHIEGRDKSCPLVPVPPHGRLIEKHDVFKLISAFPEIDELLTVEFMKALYNLPTIIPAKEGEG
jgi:hypothetical protein